MKDDVYTPDPFGPPVAWADTPLTKPVTKDDLQRMKTVLEKAQTQLAEPGEPESCHCLIVAGYLGKGYGPAPGRTTEDALLTALEKHFGDGGYPGKPPARTIHVILESLGGWLDSAFKVALYLRVYATDVRVYVPHRAKSAATLIAIGADQVIMSPFGELGPLDTQIIDPRNPSKWMSALDCYRSVDYVREFGVSTIPRALKVMLAETRTLIPLGQLIESATAFATGSVRPMLEHVSAIDFGGWGRTLRIGETYAAELRQRLRHPDSKERAKELATRLVYHYPAHPYAIDLSEAQELGIAATMMSKETFEAVRAVATEGNEEPRFVGFLEDADAELARLAAMDNGVRKLAHTAVVPFEVDTSPRANVVNSDRLDLDLLLSAPAPQTPVSDDDGGGDEP